MAAGMRRPTLRVEGSDDLHALVQLLKRHDVPYDEPWPPFVPEFEVADETGLGGGVELLLKAMPLAIRDSGELPIGFVVDANADLTARWQAIRNRLAKAKVDCPGSPPPEGFIGEADNAHATRVGVWIMPDNRREGKLEDFLRELIAEEDALIGHAEQATDEAVARGASFSKPDRIKAVVHTWLAWQEDPGRPFGTAVRAKFFDANAEAADAFVAWFKRLYGIP